MDKLNKTIVDNWVLIDLNRGREKKGKEAVGAFPAYLYTKLYSKLHTKLYTLLCIENL